MGLRFLSQKADLQQQCNPNANLAVHSGLARLELLLKIVCMRFSRVIGTAVGVCTVQYSTSKEWRI